MITFKGHHKAFYEKDASPGISPKCKRDITDEEISF